jgi:hypothetical protein
MDKALTGSVSDGVWPVFVAPILDLVDVGTFDVEVNGATARLVEVLAIAGTICGLS